MTLREVQGVVLNLLLSSHGSIILLNASIVTSVLVDLLPRDLGSTS
jgi:hypothetical protein